MKSKRFLWLLMLLLLAQLAIRTHNINRLPVFIDEYSHIRRAAVVYDLDQHPAVESHGKFLFYFLPGIFNLKETQTSLHLARVSVALASLLATTVIFCITRRLFDARAGFIAAGIYAFAPYVFFFERMALADPFAGLIATITVWAGIRFTEQPTRQRAFWLGLFVAMTPAAKLTMSFVTLTPLFSILIIGQERGIMDKFRRYFPLLLISGAVIIAFWSLVFIPAAIQYDDGVNYWFYDNWLLDPLAESVTLFDKVDQWWEKMALFFSAPMTLLWIGYTLIGTVKAPRRMSILLFWLVMAWFPMFFVVAPGSFQSRYLMAGFPALAALFGAGAITTWDMLIADRKWSFAAAASILALWIGLFVLPFAAKTVSKPSELHLPPQDTKDYFAGWFNGYGLIDSLRHIQQLEPGVTITHSRFCLPPVYNFIALDYECTRSYTPAGEPLPIAWENVLPAFEQGQIVYLLSDIYTNSLPADSPLQGEKLITFQKPHGTIRITVWRFSLVEASAPD